jgi:flagellin
LAISVSGAGPIQPALQDLNTSGQGAASGGAAPSRLDGDGTPAAAVSIGQNGSLDLGAVDALALGLNSAAGIADLALGAGQSVAGLLSTLQGRASAAQDPTLDPDARAGLNGDFKATLAQVATTVQQASFDGVNLLDGTSASLQIPGGGSLTPQNLTLGGPVLVVPPTANLDSAGAAASALAEVSTSGANLDQAMSALADQASQISAHGAIVGQLSSALKAGLPSSADAGAEGARLLALQVQQQLSAQGQPIANQSPQLVLSLFR